MGVCARTEDVSNTRPGLTAAMIIPQRFAAPRAFSSAAAPDRMPRRTICYARLAPGSCAYRSQGIVSPAPAVVTSWRASFRFEIRHLFTPQADADALARLDRID